MDGWRVLLMIGAALSIACGRVATEQPEAKTDAAPHSEPGPDCPPRSSNLSVEESKQLACGGTCESVECLAGPCMPEQVVEDSDGISALELDEEFLYWAAGTRRNREDELGVFRIRRTSGDGSIQELATVEGWVAGLGKHLNRLYWTVRRPRTDAVTGQIMAMEMPDGPITVFETSWPRDIVVNDSRVYWTDFQEGVFSAAVVGGLIDGPPSRFSGWANAVGVTDDDRTLFWTQMNLDNSIRYTDKDKPGGFAVIACHQQWPQTIAVDAMRIYWINRHYREAAGRLMVFERMGGVPRVLLDDREMGAWTSLAASREQLYWVERETAVMRMKK